MTQTRDLQISLSQEKAARAVGVTSRTLRNWEKEGLIAGRRVRPGGVKLYPLDKLRELVGAGEQEVVDGNAE